MLFEKSDKKLNALDWIKYTILLIFLVSIVIYIFQNNVANQATENTNNSATTSVNVSTSSTTNIKKATTTNILATKCNFRITSPASYSKVSMPFVITGVLDKADTQKGCVWNENSSRAGNAEVFYNRNGEGWKSAGTGVPIITSSGYNVATTTLKVSISLNLYVKALGLTSGTPLRIRLTELNILEKPSPNSFDYFLYLK